MEDLSGRSLGRYYIVEKLGEGGMATVYKAYDTRLERNVAFKVIRYAGLKTEEYEKRFEREAKALAQLSHPNIVPILDYGEHEGLLYFVMVYLPGGTLKQRMTGKPVLYQEAAKLLAPVARALEYAHNMHKIVHRDIKPANILFGEAGQPMLSDFGIAKMLEATDTAALTGTGVGIGTPEYMAPEQGLGRPVDHRVDIYALGVVFYELVTGRKPYQADTPLAVLIKQVNEPLPRPVQFNVNLPEKVEQVIFKSLAKSPEDRYQDMGEFAHRLEELASSQFETQQTAVQTPIADMATQTRIVPPQSAVSQSMPTLTAPALPYAGPLQPPVQQAPGGPAMGRTQPEFKAYQQPVSAPGKSSSKVWIWIAIAVVLCLAVTVVGGGAAALLMGGGGSNPIAALFASATPTPSDTPLPTDTPSPTPTFTYTFTLTPSYTPTATWTYTPTNTRIPTKAFTPTSVMPAGKTTVYSDNFSDQNSGWKHMTWDGGWLKYQGGRYDVAVTKKNMLTYSVPGKSFRDLIITVSAYPVTTNQDGSYGVYCRYVDINNNYMFEIDEKGDFRILKKVSGTYTYLSDFKHNDAIAVPPGSNVIKAACVGNTLSLAVNGVFLGKVQDTAYSAGDVGLFVGTWGGTVEVAFDDFIVQEP